MPKAQNRTPKAQRTGLDDRVAGACTRVVAVAGALQQLAPHPETTIVHRRRR